MIKFVEEKRSWTESISINLLFEGGLLYETKENNGISTLFSRVYQKSHCLMEKAEFHGAPFSISINKNYIRLSFSTPISEIDHLLGDFISFLTKPRFDKDIFEREKDILIKEIIAAKDLPNYLSKKGLYSILYKGTPYERVEIGEESSVNSLTLADIEDYSKRIIKQAGTVLSIAGNYQNDILLKLESSLKDLVEGQTVGYSFEEKMVIKEDISLEEEDKTLQQTKLFIGYTAPSPKSDAFFATKLLEDILGNGMSSRYFTEIRKNSGYAYAVSSAYSSLLPLSRYIISMGIDYENLNSAIEKVDSIHRGLENTLSEDDIMKAKKSIAASILNNMQANSGVAFMRALATFYGKQADFYEEEYLRKVESTTKEDILSASEIFFKPRAIYIRKPKN